MSNRNQEIEGARKRFFSEQDVSRATGRSARTLQKDRRLGRGFPYYRIQGQVVYDLAECLGIVEASRVTGRVVLHALKTD